MTIAPYAPDKRITRLAFSRLRNLRDRISENYGKILWLSMGMSESTNNCRRFNNDKSRLSFIWVKGLSIFVGSLHL